MPAPKILILTALAFEARPIARELGLRFVSRTSATGIASTGTALQLEMIGPAAKHLPEIAKTDEYRAIILAGLGGALIHELRRGDLVIDEQSETTIGKNFRRVPFATVDAMATTPDEKSEIHRATGAAVVDMENAIVRDWAKQRQIPFLGLRAISDTAAEFLDPATLRIVDEHGFLRSSRLLTEIVRQPRLIKTFWHLRHNRETVARLAREVHLICNSGLC